MDDMPAVSSKLDIKETEQKISSYFITCLTYVLSVEIPLLRSWLWGQMNLALDRVWLGKNNHSIDFQEYFHTLVTTFLPK